MKYSRRDFIQSAGGFSLALAMGSATHSFAKSIKRVVIVGGGFGGATTARYLRQFDPSLDITLIEQNPNYVTCPFSNLVLGGIQTMDSITHTYDALQQKYAIKVVQAKVKNIDAAKHHVILGDGSKVSYDRLVVSPGIDFRWSEIEGYDARAAQIIPHAWQAGEQTVLLKEQLTSMKQGGTVIVAPPVNPFRCPPGPYERVSMMAHYLKQNNPRAKILVLDAKNKFSKQSLFMQGWKKLYPGMIDWVSLDNDGQVISVDVKNKVAHTQLQQHKADVLNIIPPQKAGLIAHTAGLADQTGWCPVNQKTFESKLHKDIHVIGDASIAGRMPKSGFAANSQAKICAAAVVALLNGKEPPEPSFINTCFSFVGPIYGISVVAVYRLGSNGIAPVKGAGGVTPKDADKRHLYKESRFAKGWYESITQDAFG
jgi:sulfide dehydrogenase [flavocytochrome c] flavoprotein subunit